MDQEIGGERPLPPSSLRSPTLRAHGRSVAAYCVRRCYETWPELDGQYGSRGRQHTAADALWHLEHLDSAVAVRDPRVFADYADWVAGLLEARGIARGQVAGAFGFLAEALEQADSPPAEDAHRRVLIAIIRDNQARLLTSPAADSHGGPG